MTMSKRSRLDRFILAVAPQWAAKRFRARAVAEALSTRRYEAAQPGRRTTGWHRDSGDVNAVNGTAIRELRMHARDLIANNAWAEKGVETITGNTVGWGIVPKAPGAVMDLWKKWAETTDCDADGRLTFSGLQELALRTVVSDGEILIRRRWRRPSDGFAVPMQIQLLEADFLDTAKEGSTPTGKIVQGVEFDKVGFRLGYWLFPVHPGSGDLAGESKFVPASEVVHIFRGLRPGQIRGVSWFAQTITPLKDFDEFEDAQLMRQKIAACFAGFVEDAEGGGSAIGTESDENPALEELGPGMIQYLPSGKRITFGNPPTVTDDGFSTRTLRKIAAGLRVAYEDLTGDYSQVNFSSARMARISHWSHVYKWRHNMLIPQMCVPIWAWFAEAASLVDVDVPAAAEWTAPPMPMIEPDKEGLAISRLVRNGVMTFGQMVREQGGDPEAHFTEYAADLAMLKAKGIKLDSNVIDVSQAGLTQERVGLAGEKGSGAFGGKKPKAKREIPEETALALRMLEGGKQ